jgi:hypothetical protein
MLIRNDGSFPLTRCSSPQTRHRPQLRDRRSERLHVRQATLFMRRRLRGAAIELEVAKAVSQVTSRNCGTCGISQNTPASWWLECRRRATAAIFLVAAATGAYWFPATWRQHECRHRGPCRCVSCAGTGTPFAFGTALRVFGRGRLYAKNADVAENMSKIDTVVLDKTGRTRRNVTTLQFVRRSRLTEASRSLVRLHHPLSRAVYDGSDVTTPSPLAAIRNSRATGSRGS